VIWFLRLFSAYRAMESEMLSAVAERNRLVDDLKTERERFDAMLGRVDSAYQGNIDATRKVADFVAQTRYGRSVFDQVSELPVPPSEMKPILVGKPQASELAAAKEREFFANLRKPEQATN
jgi:hypothetical protein